MAIELIAKIKPKNNGNFFLVDASDIEMPDGTPLSDLKAITPTIGDNGNWHIGTEDTGVAAQGPKGDQGVIGPQGLPGETGDPGYSPTVTITAITGGHRVTITDATGTKTFDVMDGEDGDVADITIDTEFDASSGNPVANSTLTAAFTEAATALEQMGTAIGTLQTQVTPTVTTADNGKFLQVVNGAWAAVALTDVSEEGM